LNVLFVCVANSGRSVIAERLFRQLADGRHQARSAGSSPGAAVHAQVLEALEEVGIDASDHAPTVDRDITDKAPWVTFANGVFVEAISTRVGNYQHSPQWGTLLDQLWVR
jgi:hypothetical protein